MVALDFDDAVFRGAAGAAPPLELVRQERKRRFGLEIGDARDGAALLARAQTAIRRINASANSNLPY